jgi:hypothetical protein
MRTFIRLGLVVVGIVTLTARMVGADAAGDAAAEIARLKAEIEQLRGRLPDQSHVMKDVGYHFSNLWFAAGAKNWPLAKFYLDETRSHLKWAVRVNPVRKTKGGDLDLRVILDALDRTVLADTQKAIDARDLAAFRKAYQQTLNGCYACHTAAEKPYLRPKVPEQPETRIIDFEPSPAGRE